MQDKIIADPAVICHMELIFDTCQWQNVCYYCLVKPHFTKFRNIDDGIFVATLVLQCTSRVQVTLIIFFISAGL